MQNLYPKHGAYFLLAILLLSNTQCIPLKTAPTIAEYRIMQGKKLNKQLSKHKLYYVFENHLEDFAFYDYLDTYHMPEDYHRYFNVPIQLGNDKFYITFMEVEAKSKTLDLFSPLANAMLNQAMGDEYFETESKIHEKYKTYIAIHVHDVNVSDCLRPNSLFRVKVLKYLSHIRKQYQNGNGYKKNLFRTQRP
ncbi:MAG: hypothetical protein OIF50_01640 [Flavobacteriaceae bacterium]|nr:hypothetical protein [Flavobacteriaceae bacterium]